MKSYIWGGHFWCYSNSPVVFCSKEMKKVRMTRNAMAKKMNTKIIVNMTKGKLWDFWWFLFFILSFSVSSDCKWNYKVSWQRLFYNICIHFARLFSALLSMNWIENWDQTDENLNGIGQKLKTKIPCTGFNKQW